MKKDVMLMHMRKSCNKGNYRKSATLAKSVERFLIEVQTLRHQATHAPKTKHMYTLPELIYKKGSFSKSSMFCNQKFTLKITISN